jgi:rare lipoprotein A
MFPSRRSLGGLLVLVVVAGCAPFVLKDRADNPADRTNVSGRPYEGESSAPTSDIIHPFAVDSLDRARGLSFKPYQVGVASYYGKKFHGRTTANGERFDMYEMTAAHRGLPLGTLVRVTNIKNGRCIQVRVNDRGPYIKGRVLDLSYGAARKLGMIHDGTTKVKIDVLEHRTPPAQLRRARWADFLGECAPDSSPSPQARIGLPSLTR